jgi:serine/threonine protein kinase/ribosomal protein L40E
MSISQTTPEETTAGQLFCPQCNAALPLHATFCSSCGERLKRKKQTTLVDGEDIHTRYRITTLVRRSSHSNLYFALDNHQAQEPGHARMVAIRDIDITNLAPEAREKAIALAQQEYDNLRRWHIPHMLACIDLRLFAGHLFLVSGMPTSSVREKDAQRLHTLQDFLQSGHGLPRESRTLEWMRNLCQAVDHLHRQGMVLCDLDPFTVALEKNSAQAEPKLTIFWLPAELERLFPPPEPQSTPTVSYFKAPEALAGRPEARSDIYSLGALLYLLLTGMPPDESTLRHRRRLRSPREVNVRISQRVDECIMQALAVEPEERFARVSDLLHVLEDRHPTHVSRKPASQPAPPNSASLSDVETVRIVPLSQKNVERWRTLRDEKMAGSEQGAQPPQPLSSLNTLSASSLSPADKEKAAASSQPSQDLARLPTTPTPDKAAPARTDQSARPGESTEQAAAKTAWTQRITNILPAIKAEKPGRKSGRRTTGKHQQTWQTKHESETSLLKQIQRLILGQQQHAVEAAAIIETPMRIRPDQPYSLRLHIMGRSQPAPHPDARKGAQPAGLSALVHGEIIQVEVRSVLQQGYTYILQQATVTIPASGYAAEVTIPMQQQPVGATGRRDRLHIFFLDEHRHPLYEKPFVVEIFVSPLVQFGREGHQVLTIPI